MSYYDSIKVIVNTILVVIFIVVIIWFIRELKINRLNNRLGKYSIATEKKRHSLFDIIVGVFISFRNSINKLLYKSVSFKKYSLKYEKYIDKKNKTFFYDPMDFISTKLILSFLFLFVLLVSSVIQDIHITFTKIIVAFSLGYLFLDILLISNKKIIANEMKNELLKAITIMNNCFKSGRSIVQTIEIVSNEIDGPLKKEFNKMKEDLSYGLELEVVFERFNKRVNLKEVKYITTSLTILNKTGGNIVDVFSSIETTIFNNKKLEDELKNLSAASKALYHLLTFIPIIFVLIIYLLDSTYFMPLFINPLGIFLMILIVVIYILYIIIVKRIIKLKEY